MKITKIALAIAISFTLPACTEESETQTEDSSEQTTRPIEDWLTLTPTIPVQRPLEDYEGLRPGVDVIESTDEDYRDLEEL